ncbi:FAD-dependent oxidoreductase [Acuticoccus kandeliae]|uniref:FAD-dependent oxidoreductase n=1 Tax=Acuticoccus kandeliae TaxID=2073160 RepID=UPI000D3EC9E3|nr:FAD-dependent oxidoreductase [Acuticoccus kandeliae]
MSGILQSDEAFDASVPVLVIGAGAAGLVAALSVREAGGEAVILERDPLPRGSTALSAGLVPAAGTRWQREADVADSPALFAADIMAKAKGTPDPATVARMAETVGPALEWLADAHGLPFSLVTNFNYPGHSAHRMHGLPTRSGLELVDRLREAVERADIAILTEARARDLVVGSDGTVRGVVIERPGGGEERIGAERLILASNGYGGNKALVAELIPAMRDALYFGHPGNEGDALLWGRALGAATRHLGGHQGHGSVAHPAGILITWATIMEGGVQVNAEGRRFSNEASGYSEQAAAVLAEPGGVAWTVFDARIAEIAAQFEDYRNAVTAGAILEADTVEGLAAAMRVPADALGAALDDVARLKAERGVDEFGRRFAGVPQLAAPFRAVRVTGALFHTQGGLVVDGSARVVSGDGGPIANLFAVGGAACGVSGGDASGYLSGNGLLSAVALGRIAGLAAGAGQ